jgi:hypothetical protein
MAQQCKVCARPDRHEIDSDLVQKRTTPMAVSRSTGISRAAVNRHATNHLPKMLATLATRVDALEADQILSQIISLYERGLKALDDAESMSHDADRAKAIPALIREARANLETMAKVSVALNDQRGTETVEVVNTLQSEIEQALRRRRDRPKVRAIGGGEGAGGSSPPHASSPAPVEVVEAEVVEPLT